LYSGYAYTTVESFAVFLTPVYIRIHDFDMYVRPGHYGYLMLDLGQHTYRREQGATKGLSDAIEVAFPSVQDAIATKWSSLKTRYRYMYR
jgi:hypothetical protein